MVFAKVIHYRCNECGQSLKWHEGFRVLAYEGTLTTHDCIAPYECVPPDYTIDGRVLDTLENLTRLTYTQ